MKPYYDDGKGIVIYHGDCREILAHFAMVDLTITDPPYGFGFYSTDSIINPSMFKMILGLSRYATALFGYPEILVDWCIAIGRSPNEWITWWPTTHKARGIKNGLPRESEHIAIFGRVFGDRALRRRKQDAWTRKVSLSRGLDPNWCRDGDVWRDAADGIGINGQNKIRLHPNQKPISLISRLTEILSNKGETILDPFLGSGTTLVAAKQLSRKAIGIEIEEKYCEIAAKRLAQEVFAL